MRMSQKRCSQHWQVLFDLCEQKFLCTVSCVLCAEYCLPYPTDRTLLWKPSASALSASLRRPGAALHDNATIKRWEDCRTSCYY